MDRVIIDLDEFMENLRLLNFSDIQINKVIKAINKTIQKNSDENENTLKEIKNVLDNIYMSINNKDSNIEKTLTINEAAEISGIGEQKLREQVAKENSDFPFFKVGTKTLINKNMFLEWLNKVSREHTNI